MENREAGRHEVKEKTELTGEVVMKGQEGSKNKNKRKTSG